MKKLFYGGSIIPMTKANETVEAMLIQDQYICQTGRLETIKASHDDIDVFIDLKGRTLLPGFNDSHMHLLVFWRVSLKFANSRKHTFYRGTPGRFKCFLKTNVTSVDSWPWGGTKTISIQKKCHRPQT